MNKKNKSFVFNTIVIFLAGLVFLFIVAPILGMFLHTPLPSLFQTALEKEVSNSIIFTLFISMLGTLILSIGAIPLSWILAKKDFPFKKFFNAVINIPVIIPHSAAGIALLGFLSRESFLGKTAESFGLSFVSNPAGVMAAMAFVSLPFLINSARDGFSSVPDYLEKAAFNLGASPARVFFTISFPLAIRHIVTGLVMMWARGLSEFGAVVIIAYHPMTTPVMIFERFNAFGLKYARPVSVLFVIICIAVFILIQMLSKNHMRNTNA